MRKSERWEVLLARLVETGDIDVAASAELLGCSTATIRRDLHELEQNNLLSRVYGGAVSKGLFYELPLRGRLSHHAVEKRAIAEQAADSVEAGMTVGFTGGTTTTAVAREIASRRIRNVTVVTNSLGIAGELALHPDLRIYVTGGFVRHASLELVGPLAEETIPKLNLDLVFLGVDGVDVDAGLTIRNDLEARTNYVLLKRARRAIVVADQSKMGRIAFSRICPLADVDEIVTELDGDSAFAKAVSEAGVRVTTVRLDLSRANEM